MEGVLLTLYPVPMLRYSRIRSRLSIRFYHPRPVTRACAWLCAVAWQGGREEKAAQDGGEEDDYDWDKHTAGVIESDDTYRLIQQGPSLCVVLCCVAPGEYPITRRERVF